MSHLRMSHLCSWEKLGVVKTLPTKIIANGSIVDVPYWQPVKGVLCPFQGGGKMQVRAC